MPPRYKQDALINFYRPCWNAYERGPPGWKREGPKNTKTLLYLQNIFSTSSKKWKIEADWYIASRFSFYCRQQQVTTRTISALHQTMTGYNSRYTHLIISSKGSMKKTNLGGERRWNNGLVC